MSRIPNLWGKQIAQHYILSCGRWLHSLYLNYTWTTPPFCLSVTTNHYFSLFARRGTSARPCPRAHVWCLASGRFLFLPRPDGPETTSGVVRQRQSAGTWQSNQYVTAGVTNSLLRSIVANPSHSTKHLFWPKIAGCLQTFFGGSYDPHKWNAV